MYINSVTCFAFILCLLSYLFLFLCFYPFRTKNGNPTKWPVVGRLPAILKNCNRLHDYIVEVMEKTKSTSLVVKGPWFTTMKLLVTVDPANVQYILSQNFINYPKGPKFQEIFEVLGDAIFNADAEMWKYHRKLAQSVFAHPQFNKFLVMKTWEIIDTGLVPILDHVSYHSLEIDLQDLFGRLAFDTISKVLMGYDPGSMCIDLPHLPFSKALHDAEDAIVYRHWMPACVWKFQRLLGIGQERKYKEAWRVIDDFVYGCISRKREEMYMKSQSCMANYNVGNELGVDLMTLYMEQVKENAEFVASKGDKFLRDTILAFFSAGKDTVGAGLSWFFYLLSKNQQVLSKIREELDATIAQEKDGQGDIVNSLATNFDKLNNKLIYLHAAILEALRLYPPVPFNSKAPAEVDMLPSGHKVDPNTQIIVNMYAMGRMKTIWGEDCNEFKPERWILDTGELKHVPSHKFMAFNTGPRTCLGKNMSMIMLKATAMAIIKKYDIEPIQEHPIVPSVSVILYMKHGFNVKVATR